ncbi:HNH endonuclease [Chelativorans sp. M5D2P16]|uniref:HNH endonuclease n=1 Tax=Chelativorans sp. M5D2P16 TaxID=3095678 RepID=UPI002ACAEDFF|nr:HNH endonuclease [Chelativorans sp. M5D2P16]MDZ5696694.1 HNH endonuclease [Chelativorans sp. M5D2P16]
MTESPEDARIRLAAVPHIKRFAAGGVVTSEGLRAGFFIDSERIPLINPQRGIFKPSRMQHLLSVRTVYPRTGARVWYDDQRVVHEQIEQGEELVDYAFMGNDPGAADNRWLKAARDAQVPILYFLGVAPQRYTLIWPTYVADWSAAELRVRLAFGSPAAASENWALPDAPERRYGLRLVRQRLHQARFRESILAAYGNRCAVTGLPEPRLLDAAHIIADKDEEFGRSVVPNGLPLSKIHHAAFDANLIGIDADYRIHVSDALLSMNDGPMFEHGLKAMAGQVIKLPIRPRDYPERDRLAERFSQFLGN